MSFCCTSGSSSSLFSVGLINSLRTSSSEAIVDKNVPFLINVIMKSMNSNKSSKLSDDNVKVLVSSSLIEYSTKMSLLASL